MKKIKPFHECGFSCLTKTFRIMKITLFFVFAAIIQTFANEAYSQKTIFSLDYTNTRLEVVLNEIEELSEFFFLANEKLVDLDRSVNISVENKKINEILDILFVGTDVEYTITDRKIILTPSFLSNNVQQQRTISGKVTDSSGQSLPGVTVVIKGTTIGTVTNIDGDYAIGNVPDNATLHFSFVGLKSQDVIVGIQNNINVVMEDDAIGIEEVVAVGYGTQKKVNLTGSVSSPIMEELEKKIVTQASQLLAGEISGLTVTQGLGSPGEDQASFNVRGLGTFSGAGNSPLIIIDGMPSSLNSVNPNDISSISVLKDASSAAIYGSRGANGVILIQTKTGKVGKMQIRYESYFGKQEATEIPKYVDSWIYAEAVNIANTNVGKGIRYTQEEIEKFKSGEDPDNYPNKNHVKDLFNTGNGIQTKHNLTFSGGTNVLQYLVSSGYLRQNGIIEQNYHDRYDIRLNINSQLRENLKLNATFNSTYSNTHQPTIIDIFGTQDFGSLISKSFTRNATVPGRKSDGTYGTWMGHPGSWEGLDSESFYKDASTNIFNNTSIEWDIIKSLKLTSRLGYIWTYSKDRLFGAVIKSSPTQIFGPSTAEVNSTQDRHLVMDLFADYNQSFGNHNLHLLGGHSFETFDHETLGGFRDNFPTNTLYVLNAASAENDSNWESISAWKIRSYFGRLNYSFQEKYFLEGNVRYDGSSRFSQKNRYGLFPSVSAGWIISREEFFKVPWVYNFKIRGSYGILGNQQIGTYPYQKLISLNHQYHVGGSVQPAAALINLPFEGISWEKTAVINGGLDILLIDGKLGLALDYYNKKTSDILYNLTVSNILGMNVGEQNAGKVENNGWDFELTYKDAIGKFSYTIRPLFSVVHNKVTSLFGVERDINKGLFVGESLNSYYGYETDGLFINQQDIEDYAKQNYPVKPGYIRYKDISGPDGNPDGIVSSAYDRKVLGSTFPKHTYGLSIMTNYKDFDFYVQFQGTGGNVKIIDGKRLPLYNQGNVEQWHMEERWTEENPDRYAKFPILEETYSRPPFNDILDYWLVNSSFLRLKNLQLGYNLPSNILNSTFINQMRVYVSGSNLITFDHYMPGWDPEASVLGGYNSYTKPLTRSWNIGVNINF